MGRARLLVLAAAVLAFTAPSAHASGARCSIDKLVDGGIKGGIHAYGSCRTTAGARVAGTWTWTRVAYDATGASCGVGAAHASGSGQVADAGMVPYKLVVSFRLAPRGGGTAAQQTASFLEGDPLLRCADLTTLSLPGAETLCPVPPATAIVARYHSGQCGVPPAPGNGSGDPTAAESVKATCAWIGPPTLNGNTVSAGPFACTGGDCTVANQSRPAQGFFGNPQVSSNFVCGFVLDKGYRIGGWDPVGAIQLTDASGATCDYTLTLRKKGYAADQFVLPSNLGGTLTVTFILQSAGIEYATSSFSLHGSDGCSAFNP